jgi:Na+/alanine symporter
MDSSYFEENTQSNMVKKTNKNGVSIPTLIISLITTVVLVVIVINNFDNIKEIFGVESEIIEV